MNVAIPTGTLTKKIHGHDSVSTRMPPSRQPDRPAADGDRGPDAQRLRPLRALLEGRRDDREGRRGDERRAEALQAAGDDQPRLAVREPAEQRRHREEHEAGEEDALAPDQVARPAAEQRKPPKRSA